MMPSQHFEPKAPIWTSIPPLVQQHYTRDLLDFLPGLLGWINMAVALLQEKQRMTIHACAGAIYLTNQIS